MPLCVIVCAKRNSRSHLVGSQLVFIAQLPFDLGLELDLADPFPHAIERTDAVDRAFDESWRFLRSGT